MKDGIYTDITIEDYHANTTHISSTQIKIAKKSLKELDWVRRGLIVQEKKTHFDFGNAFELALLDPIGFSEKVKFYNPENRPEPEKAMNSKQNIAWKAEIFDSSQYVINEKGDESYETIKAMLESCFADKVIQGLIRNTEYQLSLFWTDDQTGVQLKTRPDICKRKKNVLINVKTTTDGSPQGFSRDLVKFDYPLQACMEINGCIASGAMPSVDAYYWLVVEKVPPFNATIYQFDQSDINASMVELEYIIYKIKKARDEKMFPGYSDRADNEYGILKAEIPMYYKMANV
jgi:hypothetical protein